MNNFVTEDCKVCPYCKSELKETKKDDVPIKKCEGCKKEFYIAYFMKK